MIIEVSGTVKIQGIKVPEEEFILLIQVKIFISQIRMCINKVISINTLENNIIILIMGLVRKMEEIQDNIIILDHNSSKSIK